MSTLITIPSCTALHIPTPGAAPLSLATGDLTLVLIPANPPTHPSQTVTLSIGSSAFPLLPNSPLQKVKAKEEHASYQFTPVPADGSATVGAVRITMKDSKSQGEWEATEALCTSFESLLKTHQLWEEKTLFVNDEFDTAGPPVKGWGETVAAAVMGGATTIAEKISSFTDARVPDHPRQVDRVAGVDASYAGGLAAGTKNATSDLAHAAERGAIAVGQKIHDVGKQIGAQLPDSIAKRAQPVPESEKSEPRKMAEDVWEQVSTAAKGIGGAAVTVGKSLTDNAHKAVESNFGKTVGQGAADVGQAGANVGAAGLSAFKATSVIVQGGNAYTGVSESHATKPV